MSAFYARAKVILFIIARSIYRTTFHRLKSGGTSDIMSISLLKVGGTHPPVPPVFDAHDWHRSTLTEPTVKKCYSNQRLYKGTWDKTRWCHAINPHIPHNCCDSGAYPQWLASVGCEGSWVRNADKTSWLLLTVLSSFIHPSLPSHIRAPSALGLRIIALKKRIWITVRKSVF